MPQPQVNGKPRVAIQFYGSERIIFLQPISYEREGIDEESFASLPPGVLRTEAPYMTQQGYTIEEYQRWQKTWYTDSAMTFRAENIPPEPSKIAIRDKFFLKVSSWVDQSPGAEMMNKLCNEAFFYKDYLSSVHGEAVPLHYGVWLGHTEWGAYIAVSIMQWGGLPYSVAIKGTPNDTVEVREAVLEAYRTLHMKARVVHEHLSVASHNFHVLYNDDLKRAFVVDFKLANCNHQCRLRMPL